MTDYESENGTRQANGTAFRDTRRDDWAQIGVELGHLCQTVGDQVRRAVADVDWDRLRQDLQDAMDDIVQEVQIAVDTWNTDRQANSQQQPVPQPDEEPADVDTDERMTVLNLVATGRISAAEGARLLEALGG